MLKHVKCAASSAEPSHALPPNTAVVFSDLWRFVMPPLQSFVHLLHSSQLAHSQWIGHGASSQESIWIKSLALHGEPPSEGWTRIARVRLIRPPGPQEVEHSDHVPSFRMYNQQDKEQKCKPQIFLKFSCTRTCLQGAHLLPLPFATRNCSAQE